MASNSGYDGSTTPVVSFFDKEQRARLEAITFARKLVGSAAANMQPVDQWIRVADYIDRGLE